MWSDEEHMAATSGQGMEIAEFRLATAETDADPVTSVQHVLDAVEALSLHPNQVDTAADLFRREMQAKELPRLPRASPDDLWIAAK